MPTIDTNMNIFDSPVATKRRGPPLTMHEGDEERHENNDYSFHWDDNDDNDRGNEKDKKNDKETQSTHDSEYTTTTTMTEDNYQGLLKQAARWKTTLHGVLDTVYKLRIEAAITLDKFDMMYPTQTLIDESQSGDDDDNEMNVDAAAQTQPAQDGESS